MPAAVRRKHLKGGLSFGRPSFMLDILFSKEGFNLKPKLFTKSTKDHPDPKQRQPQVGKDHLTYFVNDPRPHVAHFCSELIAYGAAQKMLSTYVGNEEEGSGFHKYIAPDGNIYPSYMLHRTVTGRTASSNQFECSRRCPALVTIARLSGQLLSFTPSMWCTCKELGRFSTKSPSISAATMRWAKYLLPRTTRVR